MDYNDADSSNGERADAARDVIPSFPNDNPELSTVDKIWGRLFEWNSPTERFRQLTRGIANHVVSQLNYQSAVSYHLQQVVFITTCC
jgi:hypothetical protein